jgi:hypothetical protein
MKVMRILAALLAFFLLILSLLFWRMGPNSFGVPELSALVVNFKPPHLPKASPLWLAGLAFSFTSILILRGTIPAFKPDISLEATTNTPVKFWKTIAITLICLGGFVAIWSLERAKLLDSYFVVTAYFTAITLAVIFFWRFNTPRSNHTTKLNFKEWSFIIFVTLAFGSLYACDVNSWRYSFIGDEYLFLTTARRMWSSEISFVPWLEACGVYCGFPFITTLYQTAHLLIFGDNNFGWRMSAVTATALCLPPAYLFFKSIARYCSASPALVAGLACCLFFSLEPIQIWAKIGKPHAFFLPPIFFSLGALSLAQEGGRLGLYGIAGLLAGVGMFFSPVGPSLAFASVGIFQALFFAQRYFNESRSFKYDFVLPLWLFALGAILGGAPIFVQSDYFETMSRLNLESSEAIANRAYFTRRTVQALLAFIWNDTNGHFILSNPFNFIVGTFTLASLCARGRSALLTLGASICLLLVFAVTVGGMSQYSSPPPSRIHLLGIPFAILSVIGLGHLTQLRRGFALRSTVILLALISIPLTYAKITLYNPYVHPLDQKPSAIRAVQSATSAPVIILTTGDNPLIRQVLSYMSEADATAVYERVEAMTPDELNGIFKNTPDSASFVITEDLDLAPVTEAQRFKDRIYPYKKWAVPSPPKLSPTLGKIADILKRLESPS